jgi:site-specific DNA-methyltransferase (adenine-specific)
MKMNVFGNDKMQTPRWLFNELNARFNFTLDAACDSGNALCHGRYAIDEGIDGLRLSWNGERVFCNPPFSNKGAWMAKAHHAVQREGCPLAVMVLPTNSMDSIPWHDYVYGKYHYHVLSGRVSFIDPETGQPKKGNNSGTTIVYFMRPLTRPEGVWL